MLEPTCYTAYSIEFSLQHKTAPRLLQAKMIRLLERDWKQTISRTLRKYGSHDWCSVTVFLRLRERHLKIEIRRVIVIVSRLFPLFKYVKYVTVHLNETDTNCVEVWRGNEMFIVMYWRSPQTVDFDHFTLLFCRGRHRNVPNARAKRAELLCFIKPIVL